MAFVGANTPLLPQKRCSARRRVGVGSRRVLIAAAATLLWLAGVAQAQPPIQLPIAQHVDLQIDRTQSFLSRAGSGFQPTDPAGHPTTPLLLSTPQNAAINNGWGIPAGSLYAPIGGNLYFTYVPGSSIQFFSGA